MPEASMKYTIVGRYIPQWSLPSTISTRAEYLTPEEFKEMDTQKLIPEQIYPIGDDAYIEVCAKFDIPKMGFCKKIFDLTNDKFEARSKLESMKDLPYTICNDNIVDWPGDKSQKLFAKPIYGSCSRDVQLCMHGDTLPDINEPYIIERYMAADEYDKVSIDGFVMGDHKEILLVGDNIYHSNSCTEFAYEGFPSIHSGNQKLRDKYFSIIDELVEKTGCDNQIIDVEFFVHPSTGEVFTMEINPRLFVNMMPIYEEITGYSPFYLLDSIRQGQIPVKKETKSGLVRWNYVKAKDKQSIRRVKHSDTAFTDIHHLYGHTFAVSDTMTHAQLYEEVQRIYPIDMIKKL